MLFWSRSAKLWKIILNEYILSKAAGYLLKRSLMQSRDTFLKYSSYLVLISSAVIFNLQTKHIYHYNLQQ